MRIGTRVWRRKQEVFLARPLKHIVVEPLDAAFCDPFIVARVVPVEMCVSGGTCNRWSHHVPSRPIGTHLTTANRHCFLCTLSPYPPVVCTHPLHSQCLSRRHAPTHWHSSRNSELTSGSVHFLNVVCTHPERCLHTIILSALSPSIAVNPPARCLAFSACPSQSLSWTFSARFLKGYLRTYSCCLRTSLPHWHGSLTRFTDIAHSQRTHAVRCRIIQDERQLARCALPYRRRCLHTPSLLLVTMSLSSLLSKKIRSIRSFSFDIQFASSIKPIRSL
jgi:hypothetical protein